MRIEAFSVGKDPEHPEANEDRFVVLPGRAYAVIDGVSARTAARYDGMLSGQYAAELVQRTLEAEAPAGPDGAALVRRLTGVIAAEYARRGMHQAVRDEVNLRFAATLALVLERPGHIEITLVGDSGVRVNGEGVHQVEKDLDGITALLRQAAWRLAETRTADPVLCDRVARQVVLQGTRQAAVGVEEWFSPVDMAAVEEVAAAACQRRFPQLPRELTLLLLQGGIINEQKRHQNNAGSPLGYSCLDGTEIPLGLITILRVPRAGLRCVELFSDGYFVPAQGFGVAAWEARFAEVEKLDPTKTGQFASVKGSLGARKADDRTYLAIDFASV